jgi:hypothetical protein
MPLKGRATKVFAFAKTLFRYPHPLTIKSGQWIVERKAPKVKLLLGQPHLTKKYICDIPSLGGFLWIII